MSLRLILAVVGVVLVCLLLPQRAQAQLLGPGAIAPCEAQLGTAGGTAWTCPFGDIRNIVNIEGGTVAYENGHLDHGKLRLNISPGVTMDRTTGRVVKEVVALSPAPGGGTVMFGGSREPLAAFVPDDSWWPDKGITFYRQPTFHQGLLTCDVAGCINVTQKLRKQGQRIRRMRNQIRKLLKRL